MKILVSISWNSMLRLKCSNLLYHINPSCFWNLARERKNLYNLSNLLFNMKKAPTYTSLFSFKLPQRTTFSVTKNVYNVEGKVRQGLLRWHSIRVSHNFPSLGYPTLFLLMEVWGHAWWDFHKNQREISKIQIIAYIN